MPALLTLITNAFRKLEHELLAHEAVLAVFKTELGMDEEIDRMLKRARGLDVIEKQVQEKYENPTRESFQALHLAEHQNQLLTRLAKWDSKLD